MPGLIGISEFVDEAIDDYNSPTTSTFVSKMPQCRQTISGLEDVSLHGPIIYLVFRQNIPSLNSMMEFLSHGCESRRTIVYILHCACDKSSYSNVFKNERRRRIQDFSIKS